MSGSLGDVLARPVFSVDGHEVTWADVVEATKAWGDWADLELAVNRPAPDKEAVAQSVKAFRYRHKLLSADDTEAWLARWGLTTRGWLRALHGEVGGEMALWAEAVLSDMLVNAARALARRHALARAVGGAPDDGVWGRFMRQVATPEAVQRAVAEHRLEWIHFRLEYVDVADEGAAREAVYCVRDDGRALADVAREAGVTLMSVPRTLADAEPELVPLLAGAAAGDVLGPFARQADRLWRVVVVDLRTEPSTEDPPTVERARVHVAERAARRETAARVVWLDELVRP